MTLSHKNNTRNGLPSQNHIKLYSNELPYEYMLALRTSDEATSWQPFVRPDPWLNKTEVLHFIFAQVAPG